MASSIHVFTRDEISDMSRDSLEEYFYSLQFVTCAALQSNSDNGLLVDALTQQINTLEATLNSYESITASYKITNALLESDVETLSKELRKSQSQKRWSTLVTGFLGVGCGIMTILYVREKIRGV